MATDDKKYTVLRSTAVAYADGSFKGVAPQRGAGIIMERDENGKVSVYNNLHIDILNIFTAEEIKEVFLYLVLQSLKKHNLIIPPQQNYLEEHYLLVNIVI